MRKDEKKRDPHTQSIMHITKRQLEENATRKSPFCPCQFVTTEEDEDGRSRSALS